MLDTVDEAQTTLQTLWASGVRFTLRYEGGAWIARVGDYHAGLGVEARARTFDEAVAFVKHTIQRAAKTPSGVH